MKMCVVLAQVCRPDVANFWLPLVGQEGGSPTTRKKYFFKLYFYNPLE